jgi:excinuclease UvrABC nuclease subunit
MKDPAFLPADWRTPNTYGGNFKEPTDKAGVYLLVKPDISEQGVSFEIMYVGSSENLAKRYCGHEVLRFLTETYGIIHFYFKEDSEYLSTEKKLIKRIQPKYNKQWR